MHCSPMRLIILSMISTNSLAAFSANIATQGVGNAGPISRVRSPGVQAPSQAAPPPKLTLPDPSSGPPSGPILPRGSLLNLSV